jgi:DNA-directed RNA polymerase subunit RPC12/RpoP
MKKQRLTFQCGKCTRKFSFQKEITPEQEWFFKCPYCGTELLLKLEPFKKKKITLVKGGSNADESPEWDYEFPPVIATQPREN